jgi:hypothetical protein
MKSRIKTNLTESDKEYSVITSETKYKPFNRNSKNAKQIGNNFPTLVLAYEYAEMASIIPEKPVIPMANAISSDCIKRASMPKMLDVVNKCCGLSVELFDT